MDRFIFHNSQYKILDTVRDMPWVGVPLPFAECIFLSLIHISEPTRRS